MGYGRQNGGSKPAMIDAFDDIVKDINPQADTESTYAQYQEGLIGQQATASVMGHTAGIGNAEASRLSMAAFNEENGPNYSHRQGSKLGEMMLHQQAMQAMQAMQANQNDGMSK